MKPDPVAIATFCLVVVGIAQLALFYWQLRLIRKSLADAKTTAVAAKESADAAKIQANVASESLDKIQRPYVYVFGVGRLSSNASVWGPPHIQYSVANYGQTPAVIRIVNVGFIECPFVALGVTEDTVPDRAGTDHALVISPILAPHDPPLCLKEFLPKRLVGEEPDHSIIVDLANSLTASIPEPRISHGNTLFFRVIISYDGPFTQGYVTSATWFYHKKESLFVALSDQRFSFMR
jgi:hypothetical protein